MFETLNINFILLLDDVFTKHNSFCVIQNGLIIKGATFNSYHYWTSVIAKKNHNGNFKREQDTLSFWPCTLWERNTQK